MQLLPDTFQSLKVVLPNQTSCFLMESDKPPKACNSLLKKNASVSNYNCQQRVFVQGCLQTAISGARVHNTPPNPMKLHIYYS